ncbi:adaptin-binding domain-containing protein [Aspergillus chevalieri]|uniref:Alpha and gamma adaptin binding protein p34 n=1 Tax=Aspergillus chevalieri TaxID=182096 RepID=A0A7R7ZI67_ASPCH|nr:uncharacterized protein ACHE_10747S [Aspergillus chevalieri]BCR83345.1 hypothetical protein ACHE_10747S [Aspergillus chevalieri]
MTPSTPSSPESTATTPPKPTPGPSNLQSKSKLIPSPRRLLILSPTSHSLTTIPPLLHTLTGVAVKDPPSVTAATAIASQDEPASVKTTFAGYTTHTPLTIENKYYKAEVPIWVDEIPTNSTTDAKRVTGSEAETTDTGVKGTDTGAAQWKAEFSGAEARVVRDAIGGVVICLKNPRPGHDGSEDVAEREDVKSLKDFLRCIGDVKRLVESERSGDGDDDGEGGGIGFGEVLGLIVLVEDGDKDKKTKNGSEDEGVLGETEKPFSISWWEDQLDDIGLMDFDIASWDPSAPDTDVRDKYGEYQGMRRIRQIIETHDWASDDQSTDVDADLGFDDHLEEQLLGLDKSSSGFNLEVNELEREMFGLRMAIERGGDDGEDEFGDFGDDDGDLKVESMEALMLRMQAIKDMSADLPESERKKFAAKAVRDIMKEM